MRRLIFLPFLLTTFLLSACSSGALHDSYDAYRHQTAAQLYHASKKDLLHGHPNQAVKTLQALNTLYPFGAYAEPGLINLIYAYYKDDDIAEAVAVSDRYLHLYPSGKYTGYAYYMKGVLAFQQGFTWLQRKANVDPATRDLQHFKQAYLSLSQLVVSMPKSPYASDAVIRMTYIRNLFAQRQARIAEFYYKRKAYVAAINRANSVIVHYDGSPWVIPALAVMVKSYRHLGLTSLENNTLTIFKASYPDSPVLKKLK